MPFSYERSDDDICAKCLIDPPIHDSVHAVVRYDEISSQIAMRLKYGTRLGLAKLIAIHLSRFVSDAHNKIIIPVPLHRKRLWARGFNQSVLIGRTLSEMTQISMIDDAIKRTKETPPLRGLTAKQRAKIISGVFALSVRNQKDLAGRDILLIDDVYTSGATANGCAKLLKKAGAKSVTVLCWARVFGDWEAI